MTTRLRIFKPSTMWFILICSMKSYSTFYKLEISFAPRLVSGILRGYLTACFSLAFIFYLSLDSRASLRSPALG